MACWNAGPGLALSDGITTSSHPSASVASVMPWRDVGTRLELTFEPGDLLRFRHAVERDRHADRLVRVAVLIDHGLRGGHAVASARRGGVARCRGVARCLRPARCGRVRGRLGTSGSIGSARVGCVVVASARCDHDCRACENGGQLSVPHDQISPWSTLDATIVSVVNRYFIEIANSLLVSRRIGG